MTGDLPAFGGRTYLLIAEKFFIEFGGSSEKVYGRSPIGFLYRFFIPLPSLRDSWPSRDYRCLPRRSVRTTVSTAPRRAWPTTSLDFTIGTRTACGRSDHRRSAQPDRAHAVLVDVEPVLARVLLKPVMSQFRQCTYKQYGIFDCGRGSGRIPASTAETGRVLGHCKLPTGTLANCRLVVGLSWRNLGHAAEVARESQAKYDLALHERSRRSEAGNTVAVDGGEVAADQGGCPRGPKGMVVLDGKLAQAKALRRRMPWPTRPRAS